MTKLPVITLMGPTASGKTALAIELHQRIGAELISVDSALIYRQMNIGTAKPSAEEQALAPHALIDICEPNQVYSAADFRQQAIALIDDIHQQGKIPLLVGGTMLYFKALVEGLSNLPSADEALRQQIIAEGSQYGWEQLHQDLAVYDPVSAQRINANDQQRLMRAIEVYRLSGKSLTDLNQQPVAELPYCFHQFAIAPKEREVLHQRIALRFQQMLEQGFEQEVRALMARGDLELSLPSMRSVGYRQMWQYLSGDMSHEEMVFRGIAATRQLAKKQLTWLRRWPELQWLDSAGRQNAEIIINCLS